MADRVRLQDPLDEIAETIAWAIDWIEELREVDPEDDLSDMPGLRAELARLRVIADALEPGRVRDATTDTRVYLAPDDASRRAHDLERALDEAERATRMRTHRQRAMSTIARSGNGVSDKPAATLRRLSGGIVSERSSG